MEEVIMMSAYDIIQAYKEGRRDFSKVICKGGDFTDTDFREIIFRNANIEGASFKGSKLQGSDFTGAKLNWVNFETSNLKDVNFSKASCQWSKFNKATLDNTDFTKADLSLTSFVDCKWGGGHFDGAILYKCAKTRADLDPTALEELKKRAGSLNLPLNVRMDIEKSLGRQITIMNKLHGISGIHLESSGPIYGQGGGGTYSSTVVQNSSAYGGSGGLSVYGGGKILPKREPWEGEDSSVTYK